MVFNGTKKTGKIDFVNNTIGKIYVGQNRVYESYSGPKFKDYSVGDIVAIPYNGGTQNCVVVHQGNPNASVYDASCDGTWLMFCNLTLETSASVNYHTHSLHTTYMPEIYNNIDASFRDNVKTVKIPCVTLSGTTVTQYVGANGITANCFPLSLNEVGYTVTGTNTANYDVGSKLSYFSSGNGGAAQTIRNNYNSGEFYTRGFFKHPQYDGTSYSGEYYSAAYSGGSLVVPYEQNNYAFPATWINQINFDMHDAIPAFIVDKNARALQ